jgi:carboxymethylenebutenolidase
VKAIVAFYGAPVFGNEPDWSNFNASAQVHVAENDEFFSPEKLHGLSGKLQEMGKDVEVHEYQGTGHAFANETDAMGTYDAEAARQAWVRTLEFLRAKLG